MSVFAPSGSASVVSPNANSQRIALAGDMVVGKVLNVARPGATTPAIYVKFGDSSVVASNSDSTLIIPTNGFGPVLIGVPNGATHAAFFSPGAVDVNVTEGVLL